MSSADHLYAVIADLQQQLATQAEVLASLQLALSQQQQPSPVRKRQHSRSYSPPTLDTSMEEVPPSETLI
jgi:hypothetical protein